MEIELRPRAPSPGLLKFSTGKAGTGPHYRELPKTLNTNTLYFALFDVPGFCRGNSTGLKRKAPFVTQRQQKLDERRQPTERSETDGSTDG